MSQRKDEVISSSRRDNDHLSRKLAEAESLLLQALNDKQQHTDDQSPVAASTLSLSSSTSSIDGTASHGTVSNSEDSVTQLAGKFLGALKEIRRLRQEKSELEGTLKAVRQEMEEDRAGHAEEEACHRECHLTQDALHMEIGVLQNRLQVRFW